MSKFSLLSFCFFVTTERNICLKACISQSFRSDIWIVCIIQESCCLCYILWLSSMHCNWTYVTNGMQIRCFNCFGYQRLYQRQYKGTQGVFSSAGTQNKPMYFCWLLWTRTCIINMNESTCINNANYLP